MNGKHKFEELLLHCVERGASDLHITSDQPASLRVDGVLAPEGEVLKLADVELMMREIMSERQREEFASRWTVDIGYSTASGERFRLNCYKELGKPAVAARHLNQDIFSLDELGLPDSFRELSELKNGLVLVTGVTGSGKSTTLAVLLNEINRMQQRHILTVEDPVEFVHKNKKSLVHHRELFTDVPSFADAVRAALREDPDVIMVGEMRDLETMRTAIIAAETGHLVFSTLHTGTAVGAVERFIGAFPAEEQQLARHRFSLVLKAIIAQHLLPSRTGGGRVPALELLRNNHAIGNLIRSSKSEQILTLMEAGEAQGMWTLDQDLARSVKARKISKEVAMAHCSNIENFERFLMGPTQMKRSGRWR